MFSNTLPWLTVKVSANQKYFMICQPILSTFWMLTCFPKRWFFYFLPLFCFLNQTFLFDQQKVIHNGTFVYLVTFFIGSNPFKKLFFSFHLYRLVHQFDCYTYLCNVNYYMKVWRPKAVIPIFLRFDKYIQCSYKSGFLALINCLDNPRMGYVF